MAEPTLAEVFGQFSGQNVGGWSLSKGDFALQGLTALEANRAESLLVAIILKAATSLTEEIRLTDLANRNVTITYSGQDLINQGGGNVFLRDTFQISLYRATTVQSVDPDNY